MWQGWLLIAAAIGLALAIIVERLTRRANRNRALRDAAQREWFARKVKENQAIREAASRLVDEIQGRAE